TSELREEYDFSKLKGGVRGKYLARYQSGTNLVLLSPDVARYFPDEQSVNKALRTLIRTANLGYAARLNGLGGACGGSATAPCQPPSGSRAPKCQSAGPLRK